MVKTVVVATHLPLAAGLYHALRCDRGFDLYSAQEGGSQYTLHSEEHGVDADGEPTVVVESTLTYDRDSVPGPIRALLGAEPFRVWSRFCFHRDKFDEAHLASFETKPSVLLEKLIIQGTVWCEEAGPNACVLHNSVSIEAKVFGVGSLLETTLAAQMRASYKGLAAETLAYMRTDSFRAFVASDSPAYRNLVPPAVSAPGGAPAAAGRTSDDGGSRLLAAAARGDAGAVRSALESGAAPNYSAADDGLTPLMMACLRGHANCAELLVSARAAVESVSASGATPLIIACERGHAGLAAWLLSAGAPPSQRTSPGGESALWWACRFGHSQCASLLLQASVTPDEYDRSGRTPLALCARHGHMQCASTLLRGGASVNAADAGGATPLMAASELGHVSMVQSLLQSHADAALRDAVGESALSRAARGGHAEVIALLCATKRELPVRLSVPVHAQLGDTLAIMTQIGAFEVPMPAHAKPGRELEVVVPVPEECSLTKLVCAFVQVRRAGVEVAAPPSARRSWTSSLTTHSRGRGGGGAGGGAGGAGGGSGIGGGSKEASPASARAGVVPPLASNTRRVVVTVPAGAKVGDTLAVQTEAGLFQLQLTKPGRQLEALVPVPENSTYPAQLTVAWVRVGELSDEMAAAAVAAAVAAVGASALHPLRPPVAASTDAADSEVGAPSLASASSRSADDDDDDTRSHTPPKAVPLWGPEDGAPAEAALSGKPDVPKLPGEPPSVCRCFSTALATCVMSGQGQANARGGGS